MEPMGATVDIGDLRVNVGLVLNGSVRTLQQLLKELETRPGVKVVYVRTSGSRLRVVEEDVRP
jgi:hypothetical protein